VLHSSAALSPSGREAIEAALAVIDALETQVGRVHAQLVTFAACQPGCKEPRREYGIGGLYAVIIWAELGDTARFSCDDAVRHTGVDISVYSWGRQTHPGAADPPRPAAAALGAV